MVGYASLVDEPNAATKASKTTIPIVPTIGPNKITETAIKSQLRFLGAGFSVFDSTEAAKGCGLESVERLVATYLGKM